MNLTFDFTGQTALVTGGTRGIGKAIAEAFLKAGAKVIVTYVSDEASAQNFLKENSNFSDKITADKFDVSDYNATESFFNKIAESHGSIDILISNSGIRRDSVLGMMKQEDWHKVIDVNLNGTYNVCKFAVLNMMKQRFGRIINVTSPAGKHGFAGQTNYSATKAALVGFTKALSKEVATRGITANCVSPGYIDTDFIKDLSEDHKKESKKSVPVRRFGTAEEVANSVLFLSSKESAYITGTVLEVTGGI